MGYTKGPYSISRTVLLCELPRIQTGDLSRSILVIRCLYHKAMSFTYLRCLFLSSSETTESKMYWTPNGAWTLLPANTPYFILNFKSSFASNLQNTFYNTTKNNSGIIEYLESKWAVKIMEWLVGSLFFKKLAGLLLPSYTLPIFMGLGPMWRANVRSRRVDEQISYQND